MFRLFQTIIKRSAIAALLFFIFTSQAVLSQTPPSSSVSDSTSPPTTVGVIAASILPAFTIGGAIYQNYATFWKNDEHAPFHFSSDPPYALHNDKFGHAYYCAMSADVIRESYMLAHVDPRTATWLGSSFSFATEFLVEIEDGFHSNTDYYGFSPGDAAADLIGASIPLLKEYVPPLQKFDYKISMWRSSALREGAYKTIFDDDESHFYWISYDIHHDMPSWPAWLNLTVGYGVENLKAASYLADRQGTTPRSQFYIGPDINLKGIPIQGKVWKVISSVLSNIKVPLPALQVGPRTRLWIAR